MKILQLIYTSCKKGLSTGAGFQTWSMSEGISEDEKHEIERYGLYVPPTDLPSQPSDDELHTLFPLAFRFFRLQSGRFGVCQASYTGQDYSGRFGNYFCHALILEDGSFPIYPIQLYGSLLFKDHLTPEEMNIETTPEPLPALDSSQLFSSPSFQFEDIMEFVSQVGSRTVKEMVSAAMAYGENQRSLILSGPPEDIPLHIASLQMAFPLHLAHQLTFSTYTHDPQAMNSVISGVPRTGSRFAFSNSQRNHENYIFDFENDDNVIPDLFNFSENVDLGYTISKESLEEFHHFIEGFAIKEIDRKLDNLCNLFRMVGSGAEGLTSEQIRTAIEFADENADPEILEQLAESLHQVPDALMENFDFKSAKIIAKFLFSAAHKNSDKHQLESAYNFFFRVLEQMVENVSDNDIEKVRSFFTAVEKENASDSNQFARRVLSSKHLKQMVREISRSNDSTAAEIYFHLIAHTIIENNYTWEHLSEHNREFHPFIEASSTSILSGEESIERTLETAAANGDFFVEWISYCLERSTPENQTDLTNSYIKIMKIKPDQFTHSIRTELGRRGYTSFLYDEFKVLLRNSSNKPEFFHSYIENVFMPNESFREKCFNDAVNYYLDTLTSKEASREYGKLVQYEDLITSSEVVLRIITGFEKSIDPGKTPPAIISEVWDIKQKRDITTSPDITQLLVTGMQSELALLDNETVEISELIKPHSDTHSLRELTEREVTDYFDWCFQYLIRIVKSPEDHEILFKWLTDSKINKAFLVNYVTETRKMMREDKKSAQNILLAFFEFYITTLPGHKAFGSVHKSLDQQVVKMLAKLPKSQFNNFRSEITSNPVMNSEDNRNQLTKVLEAVDERKKRSLVGRVKSWFEKDQKSDKKSTPKKGKKHKSKNKS